MPDLVRVSYSGSGRTSRTNPMGMRRRDRASRRRWLGALSLPALTGLSQWQAATNWGIAKPDIRRCRTILGDQRGAFTTAPSGTYLKVSLCIGFVYEARDGSRQRVQDEMDHLLIHSFLDSTSEILDARESVFAGYAPP